jgi:hypothetical protein
VVARKCRVVEFLIGKNFYFVRHRYHISFTVFTVLLVGQDRFACGVQRNAKKYDIKLAISRRPQDLFRIPRIDALEQGLELVSP